jgi:hypothetical protein
MTACCGIDAAVFGHQDCAAGPPASLRWRPHTTVGCTRECALQHRNPAAGPGKGWAPPVQAVTAGAHP